MNQKDAPDLQKILSDRKKVEQLISSREAQALARLLAGKHVQDVIGYVIVFDEETLRRACTFCPNAQLLEKLEETLAERVGFDERMTHTKVHTLYARALERAFPELYGYVDPLLSREDVQWANEEVARQKAERKEKKKTAQANSAKEETEQAEASGETPRRRRKQG